MKKLLPILLLSLPLFAQGSTRGVVINFTASTTTSVTQYSIYACTVATGGTSCTPNVGGTAVGTMAATSCSGTACSFTTTETTGSAYGFSVIAQAPACTATTPPGTPCGNAPQNSADTVTYVPVPPNPNGATNVIVVIP